MPRANSSSHPTPEGNQGRSPPRPYTHHPLGLTTTSPWPPDILQTLDRLWRSDTYMGSIRRSLCPLLGYNPSSEDVRYQAQRYQDASFHVRRPPPVNGNRRPPESRLEPAAKAEGLPAKHPVPPQGFSMLGGQIR